MIPCKHSGNIGDIIYALPALKELAARRDKKIAIYIKCNVFTVYYPGVVHPLKNVLLNYDFYGRLKPLLSAQHYIGQVEEHHNEPVDYDLDEFRKAVPDTTKNHIPRWYFPVLKLTCDLSQPWITIPSAPPGNHDYKVVIARSGRYQNPRLNYQFLKKYKCVFVGLPDEHTAFCTRFFDLPHVQINDYGELAAIIASARLFVGNQSFPFALAEGIKVPRVLEACPFANNVIPHGVHAYDVYSQRDFETYIEEEMKHEENHPACT